MEIAIDASRYSHEKATGVEHYSWKIINGLVEEIDDKDHLILYSRDWLKGSYLDDRNDRFENRVIKGRRFWTLWHLSGEIRKNCPDVLFVPSHVLPLTLAKRNVIMIHDVAFRKMRKVYSFFQYHYLNWSTKYAVKYADKILVPSRATADDLEEFFECPKTKIAVIPHGFSAPEKLDTSKVEDDEVFKYFGIDKKMKYLLFVGRLESKKNLERVVRAFGEFSKDHPNYHLVLAGKRGLGFKNILRTVAGLDLMEKVIMPGYITEEEKAYLYEHAEAFVFPSLYEGFGLPILEAFHYGVPVLTSDVASLPEVGGEAVHYVDPLDETAITAGMKKLIEEKEYGKSLVSAGKERLKQFSWEKAVKKTLNVLKNGQ